MNLYGYDKDGNEVLMTKDHIVPKSLGGRNCLENYQTMCCVCNCNKGNGEIKTIKKENKLPKKDHNRYLIRYGNIYLNIKSSKNIINIANCPREAKSYTKEQAQKLLDRLNGLNLLNDKDLNKYDIVKRAEEIYNN